MYAWMQKSTTSSITASLTLVDQIELNHAKMPNFIKATPVVDRRPEVIYEQSSRFGGWEHAPDEPCNVFRKFSLTLTPTR